MKTISKDGTLYFVTLSLVLSLCTFSSCQPEYSVLPPKAEDKPIVDANTMVIYECNERLFAETEAFKAIEAYIPTPT